MSTTRNEIVNTVAETPTTTTTTTTATATLAATTTIPAPQITTTTTSPTPSSCEQQQQQQQQQLGNMNNKNANSNNKSNNNAAEQPQTKRQKIEKQFKYTKNINTNSNNSNSISNSSNSISTTNANCSTNNNSNSNSNNNNNINNNNNSTSCSTTQQTPILNPAPNIGGVHNINNSNNNNNINENNNNNNNNINNINVNMTLERNKEIVNSGGNNNNNNNNNNINNNNSNLNKISTQNNRHLSSSLSSSVHSISPPSSSNNSPNSTPSSSRATSFSHLINEQNLANTVSAATMDSQNANNHQKFHNAAAADIIDIKVESINGNASTTNNSNCMDEVDRIDYNDAKTRAFPIRISSLPSTFYNDHSDCDVHLANSPSMSATTIIGSNQKQHHSSNIPQVSTAFQDMNDFEEFLKRQCLCGVSENALRRPFQSHYYIDKTGQKRIANLSEWPTSKLIQFLSNLQLLFEIYLKQNSKGFICGRIMDVCEALIRNDHNLIDEIIVLASYDNSYVQFLSGRVLTSFLVIAKHEMDEAWLKKLVDNLFSLERSSSDHVKVRKIHFSLDIIKRVVEWRDVDLHPLEDEITENAALTYSATNATNSSTASSSNGSNSSSTQLYPMPISSSSQPSSQISLNNGVPLLENHAFLHFPVRQHSLDENYFAVHFGAFGTESNDHYQNLLTSSSARNADFSNNSSSQVRNNAFSNNHRTQQQQQQHQQEHEYQSSQHHNPHLIYSNSSYLSPNVSHVTAYNNDTNSYYNTTTQSQPPPPSSSSSSTTTGSTASESLSDNFLPISSSAATTSSLSLSGNNKVAMPLNNGAIPVSCQIVTLTDSESFDTTNLKCITIKILENKWQELVNNMSLLITNGLNVDEAESSVLAFLQLWENIISVKANLSVVETLPFYAQLDKFEMLLDRDLPCTVYKQMLCLFNEALCYGSTLALQDMLPRETCSLAHQIVRHVKDFRMLEKLPRRRSENVVGLIGYKGTPIVYRTNELRSTNEDGMSPNSVMQNENEMATNENVIVAMDKTILQKVVLLVLKSIAVSVKEIRSDSSDSSIDSTDSDALQDMRLIEQSMRDVLRKLETFIKQTLEFHPQCHFSKILIRLFDDQDDHLIEAMVCTLDVTSGLSYRNNAFPELVTLLNPVYTFLEFLKMISNSSDLLLDLLVSNETCFLLYLLRFLKYVRSNWLMFVRSCRDFGMGANTLEETMGVLNRLRMQISRLVSRQLYPYDISPVLRLLEHCDSLYEGNELA